MMRHMKLDPRLILLGSAIAVVLAGGAHIVHHEMIEVKEHHAALEELDVRLHAVRADRAKLGGAAHGEAIMNDLPRARDAVTQRALLRAALERLLATQGLRGTVVIHEAAVDPSFPSQMRIEVVPIEVGIEDYTAYSQVVAFMEYLTRHPFTVDALCIGCNDIGSTGRVRLSLRYYVPPA